MSNDRSSASPLAELLRGGWGFHGVTAEDTLEIGLTRGMLEFIVERVAAGDRTLETGSGYSTIAFALAGADHTAVSPVPWEHARIRRWCDNHDVSLDRVRIIEGFSQDVLPGLELDPLDFVLIDGDHSFPTVFIDYWYGASLLRTGGLLMVDDTQIRTCHILCQFLEAETGTGRWRVERRYPNTAVFKKATEELIGLDGWTSQPFCMQAQSPPAIPLGTQIRARLRPRARLQRLRGRLRAIR